MSALRALCLGLVLGLVAAGCDAGGLLDVAGTQDAGPPPITGPSTNEMVNAGNVASNGKYKVVFTMGQASPNQGPETSPEHRVNGGIVGAMNGN